MKAGFVVRAAVVAALLLMVAPGAGAHQSAGAGVQTNPVPAALRGVERGQWILRSADGERKLCLTNVTALVQLAHGDQPCRQIVMDETPRSATVRYICPGHGQGRSVVSVETPRSLHLETQGVIDGAPFSEDYEARFVGTCG
jgi:hypothetical protein